MDQSVKDGRGYWMVRRVRVVEDVVLCFGENRADAEAKARADGYIPDHRLVQIDRLAIVESGWYGGTGYGFMPVDALRDVEGE